MESNEKIIFSLVIFSPFSLYVVFVCVCILRQGYMYMFGTRSKPRRERESRKAQGEALDLAIFQVQQIISLVSGLVSMYYYVCPR